MNPTKWGNIFESGVGAYIVGQSFLNRIEVFYWRERNLEVDFILRKKGVLVAIEVKSNLTNKSAGLTEFQRKFNPHRSIIIGDGGMSLQDFFSIPILSLFN